MPRTFVRGKMKISGTEGMTMIEVQPSDDGRSFVIMMQGMPVFRGTMRECEDWLDFRENRSPQENSERPEREIMPPKEDGLGRSA